MNLSNKLLFSWQRFKRWHPKIALRYLPIVEEINRINRRGSVLETGSGPLGIAPYLGREVTGVDVDFSGPKFFLLKQVKGDATKLPLADYSYDFVVSVDLLEHLAPQVRQSAILEALRVAKRAVFIAVPTGLPAQKQDEFLDKKYKEKFGKPFPFLTEHLAFGLPKEQDMVEMIQSSARKLGKPVTIRSRHSLNLTTRRFLMWGWMTDNALFDFCFRKVFLIFIPALLHFNFGPTYRTIFFVYIG